MTMVRNIELENRHDRGHQLMVTLLDWVKLDTGKKTSEIAEEWRKLGKSKMR